MGADMQYGRTLFGTQVIRSFVEFHELQVPRYQGYGGAVPGYPGTRVQMYLVPQSVFASFHGTRLCFGQFRLQKTDGSPDWWKRGKGGLWFPDAVEST